MSDTAPSASDLARRRFIGVALLHVHTFNEAALRDLFGRLPDPLRVRAARAVSDKLVLHASHHGCWAWCCWAAHVLPTAPVVTFAAEFVGRLGRAGR